MAPLISIITPSFNQGEYIEETINSVLCQDYANVEHIIVDGGSKDNTLDVLRKYDSTVMWISEEDRGQADAIDKGIRMAKGEIVSWLNSDDLFLPGAVNKVVDVFDRHHDVKMVYGMAHFIDADGRNVGRYPTEPFDFERLAMFNFICQPSAFFKKEAYCEVGGLDLGLHYALDCDLWIRIAQRFSVKYLPEFLSCYRRHETSKTVAYEHASRLRKEGLEMALKYYNWAPANKVYGYYYHLIEPKLPQSLRRMRPLTVALSLLFSSIKYLQLNKRIRYADIKALNLDTLKKLYIPWKDLYKTY